MSVSTPLSPVEDIKLASRHLRGSLVESLADPLTGALRDDDTQLVKFHGIYQQDDRDLRNERRQQRLEPAYQFMIRARVPGGICTAAQWLAMDRIACTHANGTMRLTTRQTFQLHGVIKRRLKATVAEINHALLDTLAACGDVNRNVMCTTLPSPASARTEVTAFAAALSDHLTPRTRAYHEIWLDQQPVINTAEELEPIYGDTYLPRKFKIGLVVPPDNDVDIYSQDLGFIAIIEHGQLTGFNVVAGGGMGMTHGEHATYPRLAEVLGYCDKTEVLKIATAVVTTQRDFGDRTNRKHARLKYTVETMGLKAFQAEVETRAGVRFTPARDIHFTHTGDRFGWHVELDGTAQFTLFVESGRVADVGAWHALTGLREIANAALADFHLTPNQNVVLANIAASNRSRVTEILTQHGLDTERASQTRQLALACVGFPTCGLAMAESERYVADFVTKIDALFSDHGLPDAPVTLRITGCPNGCARPYLAEIALVGKAPGRYNLYLGAAFDGTRMNAPYREALNEIEILEVLAPLVARYAAERESGEHFGNYLVRAGHVPAILSGVAFAAAAQALAAGRGVAA